MPPQTSATTKPGIPWSVKGVDLETREAAKDAARRAGMTLGEWLNTIIADTSDEGARRRARRLKDEAEREELAERIERLARAGREAARHAAGPEIAPAIERLVEETRYRNEALEQKTATALGALVGFIERSDQTRRREVGAIASAQERTSSALREALHLVTQRLDALERNVAGGTGDGLAPLRQAVSRLEDRIDDLGTREAAGQFTGDIHEAMRGLEQRLVEIAERLDRGGMGASPTAEADAQRIEKLEAALGALVDRLGSAGEGDAAPMRLAGPDPLLTGLREDVKGLSARMEQLVKAHAEQETRADTGVEALRGDVGFLAKVVEGLPARIDVSVIHRELASLRKSVEGVQAGGGAAVGERLDAVIERLDRMGETPVAAASLSPLQDAIEDIRTRLSSAATEAGSASLDARFDTLEARIAALDHGDTLGRIDARLDSIRAGLDAGAAAEQDGFAALAGRVERILAAVEAPTPTPDFSPLQAELSAMRKQIEAASRPDAGSGALDALQAQIASLAEKLDRPDDPGIAAILSLEKSVGELFTRIEEARRSTVEAADASARKAADEVLAKASGLPAMSGDPGMAPDAGTRAMLDAVQDTLERIVDRLAALESDMAGDRVKLLEALRGAAERGPGEATAAVPAQQPTAQQKIAAALAAAEAARALGPKPTPAPKAVSPAPEPRPVTAPGPVEAPPVTSDTMSFDAFLNSAEAAQTGTEASLPAADMPLEPGTGRPATPPEAPATEPDLPAPEKGKSAFIAAARLAAQTSGAKKGKAEAKLAASPDAGAAAMDKAAPAAGRYRRPLLIGLAAIVLAFAAAQIGRNVIADGILGYRPFGGGTPAPDPAGSPAPEQGGVPAAPEAAPAPEAPAAPPATGEKQSDASGELQPPPAAALEPTPSGQPGSFQASAPGPDGSGFSTRDPEAVGAIAPAPSLEGVGSRLPAPSVPAQGLSKALQRAAAEGNAAASFEIASRYFEGKGVNRDTKLAAAWFEKAALAGSTPAQYRIGSMYEKGVGVGVDLARARTWYQRGAEAGNVKAMHNLGVVLADGAGDKPDYAAASQWFRKAAGYGLRDSQYNLAILAARGLGMDKDLAQSWTFFALAAAQGDADAGRKRDEVGARLDPESLARAKAAVDGFVAMKPDPAANEVAVPPGGWDREQTGDARKDKAKSARL